MTRDEAPTLLQHVDPPDAAHEQPDLARRRILVAATTALGGVGIAAATVPFISSMLPSEKSQSGRRSGRDRSQQARTRHLADGGMAGQADLDLASYR